MNNLTEKKEIIGTVQISMFGMVLQHFILLTNLQFLLYDMVFNIYMFFIINFLISSCTSQKPDRVSVTILFPTRILYIFEF